MWPTDLWHPLAEVARQHNAGGGGYNNWRSVQDKMSLGPLPHAIHGSSLEMDRHVNVRIKMIRLLEENIGGKISLIPKDRHAEISRTLESVDRSSGLFKKRGFLFACLSWRLWERVFSYPAVW